MVATNNQRTVKSNQDFWRCGVLFISLLNAHLHQALTDL